MKMSNTTAICLAIAAAMIAGFALGLYLSPAKVEHTKEVINKIERDTSWEHIPGKTTVIEHAGTIVYRDSVLRDTIHITRPFTASADTICGKDTIGVKYVFPQNMFSMKIAQGRDSVPVIREKEIIYMPLAAKWYDTWPAKAFGAVIISGISAYAGYKTAR